MPEKKCKHGKVPEGKNGRCIKPKDKHCLDSDKVPEGKKGHCIKPKEKHCKNGKVPEGKNSRCVKPKTEKKRAQGVRRTRKMKHFSPVSPMTEEYNGSFSNRSSPISYRGSPQQNNYEESTTPKSIIETFQSANALPESPIFYTPKEKATPKRKRFSTTSF